MPDSRLFDYSRLGRTIFARETIQHLSAVVVGAGALGNEVVKALGLLGAARVLIVDPDKVESSDLLRSVLLRLQQFNGCNKAVALAAAAGSVFPDTRFSAAGCEIADLGFGSLVGAGLLFSCVDSDLARLEIAHISTKLGIAVCDAGLGTPNYSHCRVSWFPGAGGACFGCKLTPRKRRELLTLWDATIHSCRDPDGSEAAPSTPTMAAIAGSAQVELGLRWKMKASPDSENFEISLDGEPRADFFRTPQSPSCPFHEGRPEKLWDLPRPDAALSGLLESAGGSAAILLDWPVVVAARCRNCGLEWRPMRRAALVRRKEICAACGSRTILEKDTIRAIAPGSEWSRCKPVELGLPEDHRYTMRFQNEVE